ncbi:MAG: hypothetical protein HYW49_06055 [Deltaproteobacteria bacterium]|nr:hypothetical protein [Deltaproteobacteria bacterium]
MDEPLVVSVKYPVQWIRPRVDLVELAKLRRDGWTIARLSLHFRRPRSTIYRKLKAHEQGMR